MGRSYLKYDHQAVEVRDGTLGMLCSVFLHEFAKFAPGTEERTMLRRLEEEIIRNSYCSGYTTVIDLQKIYPLQSELRPLVSAIGRIIEEIRALGNVLPVSFLEKLPEKAWIEGEIWYAADIIDPLTHLKEILVAAGCTTSSS